MKHFNLLLCLFLFLYGVNAQNQSIDSLKAILKTAGQDTNRVNALNAIAINFFQNNQFDSALRYTKPAAELAEKFQYQKGLVAAYHNLAVYNFHIKEYKPGKFFLIKSLNSALLIRDKKSIANDYKELADLFQLQGNFKLEKESKEKFVLYSDSLTKEENEKHTAELKEITEKKEKEKADLAAKDAKATSLNDAKRQRIFYISLAVLLVLSILLVWLLVNRSKLKARKLAESTEENIEDQSNTTETNIAYQQKTDDDKLLFLQKIAEKEVLSAKLNNNDKEQQTESPILPMPTIADDKLEETKPEKGNIPIEHVTAPKLEPTKKDIESDIDKTEIENRAINIVDEEKIISAFAAKQISNKVCQNQLLYFTAKLADEQVKLVWETTDEKNIIGFSVGKSIDNVQFINIETIAAKGIGSREYETFDLQPLPGINYYRLEIIDVDENLIFSEVVQIEVLPATTLELICYPTHVKDIIMVTAAGGKSPVVVNIYNSIGKKELTMEIPPTTTPLFLNTLPIGNYSLQMKCQGKTVLQQLIKIA